MRKSMKLAAAAAFTALSVGGNAQAAPVEWTIASGGNGHFYDYNTIGPGQPNANVGSAINDAASRFHNGQQGYLITLTSAAEQAFYISQFGAVDGWIGAFDVAQEGVWNWEFGPETGQQFWQGGPGPGGFVTAPFNYASWAVGQPDNMPNLLGNAAWFNGGAWQDTEGAFQNSFYLIEFNAGAPAAGVPEPLTVLLIGTGLACIAAMRRRRECDRA